MRELAWARIIALNIILAATALRDDFATIEEIVGNVDSLVKQPSRIGPQIDDITQRSAAGRLVNCEKRCLGLVSDIPGEGVDVDIANAVLDLPLDGSELDALTHQCDLERLV